MHSKKQPDFTMDADKTNKFSISCTNVPPALLQSAEAKQHFSQFGRLLKLHLRPKAGTCRIQFVMEESVDRAVKHAGEYKGQTFAVSKVTKAKQKLKKSPDPTWLPDPDIQAELDAMEGTGKYHFRNEAVGAEAKVEKKQRMWPVAQKKAKKPIEQVFSMPTEQKELINFLKQPALSVEEKYRTLDARDKLIRLRTLRQADLMETRFTVGTCPDMCPEKERLMRETQHQVALYEQEPSSKAMNPRLAVKQYSRSSADQESPLPHELRPVSTLQMTMGYLMHSIIDLCDNPEVNLGEWYHFLWDRTRGIRKDITQQELCCQGSVELVEQCARFHMHCSARLVAEDPSVFDHKINTENLTKCLQTLKYMYHDLQCKNESCPNEAEFRSYIILLNLNDGNFMWEVQQLRPEIQKSKEVRFALEVYSALDTNNYVKFFKLVRETTYLNACILLRYFIQVRVKALRTIIKGYSPRVMVTQYPLTELRDILAFEGNASTRDFLEYYGLKVNGTHVILDRLAFILPELPYTLDRAINIVESKRTVSVGEVVGGGFLPPKIFETHSPHTSFDSNGYLNTSEYFVDLDFSAVQKDDDDVINLVSRSNSPFDTVDNAKPKGGFKPEKVFTQRIESKPVFGQKENIFGTAKPEKKKSNIYGYRQEDFDSQDSTEKGLGFGNPGFVSKTSDVFGLKNDSVFGQGKNIFGPSKEIVQKSEQKSVFGSRTNENIFGQRSQDPEAFTPKSQDSIFGSTVFGQANQTKTIFGQQSPQEFGQTVQQNIFGQKPNQGKSIFGQLGSNQNVFKPTQPIETKIPESANFNQQRSPYGGFYFPLKVPDDASIKLRQQKEDEENRKKLEEEERLRQEEEGRKIRELQAKQRLENERKLQEERRLEELQRRKLEAEENRRRELERIRLEEIRKAEEKRKFEEIRRLEEIKKSERIKFEVRLLVEEMVTTAEETYKKDRLSSILESITNRKMRSFINKWKTNMILRKRKRKAIDDWPIWLNSLTIEEEAKELVQQNQSQVLMDIKRYKSGVCKDLSVWKPEDIKPINFRDITAKLLKSYIDMNLADNKLYWKVNVSLPTASESKHNLRKVVGYVYSLLNWAENRTSSIETIKICGKKVTYCIRKHDKFYKDDPCDGYIFINDVLSENFLANIETTLENCNFKPSVSIVLILNEISDTNKIDSIVEKKIIHDYKIICKSFTPSQLEVSLKEGFEFLAKNVSKPPTLELDSFKSFLVKYLATEPWERINSFAKFNRPYALCLTNPKIVYNLYRDALARLENMVFDKNRFAFKTFPKDFENLLEKPDYFPCRYQHFPAFWKNESYNQKLRRIFEQLRFQSFDISWPPVNMTHLEKIIYRIAQSFENSDKVFYTIVGVILRKLEQLSSFDDIKYMLWTDVIEIIILEKIKEFDFGLREPFVSDFDELFVIYDSTELHKFNSDMWFYLGNSSIESTIDCKEHIADDSEEEIVVEEEEIDLEKTFTEAISYDETHEKDIAQGKTKIKELEMLMKDLEESMRIQKKISSKFEDTLSFVLDKR